ncbi:MAG: 6-pyruvoyl-tetrahydropterin synthase-related protein [Syntrophomonadaceae bacterium]|nr:6-pyruvoyl-tetrahydropterin synthase-related protein [Syntrophomonadaceae bacterium]
MQSDKVMDKNDTPSENVLKEPNLWLVGVEIVLAVLAITTIIIWAVWPILGASNDSYPVTTDGLGHLMRIEYMADCLRNLEWPSWFPYIHNGSMVMQYNFPLSLFLMTLIQIATDNVMITFKIGVFISLFVGGLGVWYICYRFVGPWVGILGGMLYTVQPFLLWSLLNAGEMSQIIIFAIAPWLLCFSLLFFEQMSSKRWFMICISSTLIILAHPMSALLTAIGIGIVMLVLVLRKHTSMKAAIFWIVAMGLGAALEAFWAVPGLTHLENPTLPATMPEYTVLYAATTNMFNSAYRNSYGFYVGYAMLLSALGSITQVKKSIWIPPLLIAFLLSVYLSFGSVMPLYAYIPLSDNFIPRKFLSFSALAAIILNVYFFNWLLAKVKSGNYLIKGCCLGLIVCILIWIAGDLNPRKTDISTDYFSAIRQELDEISLSTNPFEQGRFTSLSQVPSYIYYFPMIAGFNMTQGDSVIATPHISAIKQTNIAIPSECPDYVVKNLLDWNTRSVYISNEYEQLSDDLARHGFQVIKKDAQRSILLNPTPSSYFMRQERNAIAIGLASPPLVITFPWLVQGESASLEDYSLQYLDRFRLIYLIEPDVKDFRKFQKMVVDLLDSGKTVVVSMGHSKVWPLAGIVPYWETITDGAKLAPTNNSPFNKAVALEPDPTGQAPAMGNLDGIWMEMQLEDKRVPAIGYKNIHGKKLYFVGLDLDKQLNAATRWARGYQADIAHSKEIAAILEQIMDIAKPNKNIVPVAFPVSDAEWGHDSFSFEYKSDQPVSIFASVTYAPRWKGTLDSSPLKVQQLENLILLDLPAGEHQVSMHYGMTWVGWLGIGLSLLSLLLIILYYIYFDSLNKFFDLLKKKSRQSIMAISE